MPCPNSIHNTHVMHPPLVAPGSFSQGLTHPIGDYNTVNKLPGLVRSCLKKVEKGDVALW